MGAGPVGLFAAFQVGLMGLTPCLIDVLEFVGGQCAALYPEKPIYDIPACPAILASDLIKNLELQAKPFKPELFLGQTVEEIVKKDSNFILRTNKSEIKARAIIITIGGGAFIPNRPPISDLVSYENKSVFYTVTKKDFFVGKDIVIFGGGDSAVDWAVILAEIAKSVVVVHRRDKFRCMPDSLHKLTELSNAGKVKIETPYQIAGIKGHDGQVTEVEVEDQNGARKNFKADAVLLFFGLTMNAGPIANWQIELDKKQIKVTPENMQTNISGIYAAGDGVIYPGKLKLILTGFSEAALAARSIYSYLNPEKLVHFEHSTSRGELFK